MQDIHSVDGEIRRLRPHHHPTNQALNCPRCDSSNTKFCYYNNYNLSQPRHFCKGCRRYWTNGGVLRNVPIGGGSRRKTTKRSTPKSSPSLPTRPKSTSYSSSDSSSLTAATTTTATATEAVSAPSSRSPTGFLNMQEFVNPSQGSDLQILEEENANCGFFSGIGSLITSSNDHLSFRFDDLLDPQTQWEQVAAGSGAVEVKPHQDDDVKVEFSPATGIHRSCTSIFRPPSEWEPSSDEGLFDLPDGVDHWTQINPWSDVDQPTYIP